MTTPEGRIKDRVKKLLKEHGAYYHMPVQNGMGSPSLDFTGVHRGRGFGIETKAGHKQPTPRQELTIAAMRRAGAAVFVVNEVEGLDTLRDWLTGEQI